MVGPTTIQASGAERRTIAERVKAAGEMSSVALACEHLARLPHHGSQQGYLTDVAAAVPCRALVPASLMDAACVAAGFPAALLRELVKEMPPEKRLSFQTRVANARTKEEVESVLNDFAPRLACLALPHARSREVDLLQVKKVRARRSRVRRPSREKQAPR